MNKQTWPVFLAVAVLVGGCAVFLLRLQGSQTLGKPGVKVVNEPSLDEGGKAIQTNSVFLPARVLNYQSKVPPVMAVELGYLPKDTVYGRRVYFETNRPQLHANVVLMGADRSSIHKPQFCLTGQGFHIDRTEVDSIPMTQPHAYDLPVMKLTTTTKFWNSNQPGKPVEGRAIYVYWFVADGEMTALHGERMWWMARDMVRSGVLQRWAYASVLAYCEPGREAETYEQMKQFIIAAVPQFQLAAGPNKLAAQTSGSAPN